MTPHKGFWIDVDGQPIHILGDPEMSKELVEALANMARELRRGVEAPETGQMVTLRDPETEHEMVFNASQVKIIALWKSLGYVVKE